MTESAHPDQQQDQKELTIRENLLRFAGLTAVARDGEPFRVFHGTSSRFDAFDVSCLGWNVNNPTTTLGFFFTEQKEGAWRWAKRRGHRAPPAASPEILEVYLSIEKPRLITHEKFDHMLRRARASTINKFKQDTLDAGYDGFRIEYVNPEGLAETWWVAFRPEQIKSATHNFGTFDSSDPSMTDRAARERAAENEIESTAAPRKALVARP